MGRGRPRKGDDAPGGERRAQQRASKARCKARVEAAAATIARESRANRGSVVGSVGAQGHAADREAKAAALDVIARRVVSANPRRVQRGLFAKRELAVGAVHLRYWGAPLTRKEVCPLSLSLVLPSLSLSRSGVCAHVTLSVRVFLCVCFAGCVCVRVFRWQVVSTRSRYVATLRNGTGIDGKAVPESLARLVNDGPAPNCEFDEQAGVLCAVSTLVLTLVPRSVVELNC